MEMNYGHANVAIKVLKLLRITMGMSQIKKILRLCKQTQGQHAFPLVLCALV